MLVFGLSFALLGFLSDSACALAAGTVAERLRGTAGIARVQRWVGGGVLVGSGILAAVWTPSAPRDYPRLAGADDWKAGAPIYGSGSATATQLGRDGYVGTSGTRPSPATDVAERSRRCRLGPRSRRPGRAAVHRDVAYVQLSSPAFGRSVGVAARRSSGSSSRVEVEDTEVAGPELVETRAEASVPLHETAAS